MNRSINLIKTDNKLGKKRGSDNSINISASFVVNPSARSVTNLELDTNRSLMFFNNFQKINSISASPKRAAYNEQSSSSSKSFSSSKYLNLEKSDKFSNLVEYLQEKLTQAIEKKMETKMKYSCRSLDQSAEKGSKGGLTRPARGTCQADQLDQTNQGSYEVDRGVD